MSTPIPIKQLHHISLRTKQLDASRQFYRDVLGFAEIPRARFNFDGAWLFAYGLQIHLIVDETLGEPSTTIQTRHEHIAFEVTDTAAVERVLQANSIEYKLNTQASTGVQQIFCRDPDGHYLEFGAYGPTKTTGSW
jgi:catechol 2,3-dioxygenase-like lactoylglutathione lyase family enzyme